MPEAFELKSTHDETRIPWSAVTNIMPMSHNPALIPSEDQVATGDETVFALARRKAWVSGLLKNDTFVYYTKGTTSSGSVTFYITDNGLSTGTAVFTNVYADTITVTPYGASAYQITGVSVSGDKKSVTATVTQTTAAILGLLSFVSASNGTDCRLLVLGD